jgi:hypothetical protein
MRRSADPFGGEVALEHSAVAARVGLKRGWPDPAYFCVSSFIIVSFFIESLCIIASFFM